MASPINNKDLLSDRVKIKAEDGLQVISPDTNNTSENEAILGKEVTLKILEIDGSKIADRSIPASKLIIAETTDSDSDSTTTTTVLGGTVLQQIRAVSTSYASTTSAIPYDTSIPQNTEGTELFSESITPTSTSSVIRVEFTTQACPDSNLEAITFALFQDTTTDAVAATTVASSHQVRMTCASIDYYVSANTLNNITFSLRWGTNANTGYINGVSTGDILGASTNTTMIITEYSE